MKVEQQFDKHKAVCALSRNLNEETIKQKNGFKCSNSKNSMSVSNSSAKENANVKSKNKNESEIQDKCVKKCVNLIDSLFNIQKYHSNKIFVTHININSLTFKFDVLTSIVNEYINTVCSCHVTYTLQFG